MRRPRRGWPREGWRTSLFDPPHIIFAVFAIAAMLYGLHENANRADVNARNAARNRQTIMRVQHESDRNCVAQLVSNRYLYTTLIPPAGSGEDVVRAYASLNIKYQQEYWAIDDVAHLERRCGDLLPDTVPLAPPRP